MKTKSNKRLLLIVFLVILFGILGGGVVLFTSVYDTTSTSTKPTSTQINNIQMNENTRTNEEETEELNNPNKNQQNERNEEFGKGNNKLSSSLNAFNKNSNKLPSNGILNFIKFGNGNVNIETFDNYQEKENQKMPTTGSEPTYDESQWNDPNFVKTNNCYAYFLDDKKDREQKPQPGYFSGNKSPNNYNGCIETERRVLADNPDIYIVEETQSCKNGYYKGFLAIDTGKDYHFYRQDSSGFWSHKPGGLQITNLDSNGEIITNPRKASRNYSNFQYTTSCNYFCVPKNEYKKTNAK